MNCAAVGEIDRAEILLSGVRLERRALLVQLAVSLLEEGLQTFELGPALEKYVEAKGWPPLELLTRQGIVQSARDVMRKAAAEAVAEKAKEPATLQVVSLSEMDTEAVGWLWPGRIPLGKVTVICGESGLGKTSLVLDLVARVSAGELSVESCRLSVEEAGAGEDIEGVRLESLTYGAGPGDGAEEQLGQLSVDGCRLSVGEAGPGPGEEDPRLRVGLRAACCAAGLLDSEDRGTGVEQRGSGAGTESVRLESLTYGAGRVLLLNGEDHWGDSIRPRLVGGGARFENITAIGGMNAGSKESEQCFECFQLERDIPVLRQQIETLGDVRLVIIDSLEAHCGVAVGQRSLRMRKLVAELVKLADECGVAVVVVSSRNKCDLPVKYVWKVDCDVLDPELRLWLPVKFNSGQLPRGLGYRVTETGIAWDERQLSTQPDWLQGATAKQERSWRLMEVVSWLKGYLGQKACPTQEVLDSGCAFGWTVHQLKRAKLALDLECYKETGKNGRWFWRLSDQPSSAGSRPSLDATLDWLDRRVRQERGSVQENKECKEFSRNARV